MALELKKEDLIDLSRIPVLDGKGKPVMEVIEGNESPLTEEFVSSVFTKEMQRSILSPLNDVLVRVMTDFPTNKYEVAVIRNFFQRLHVADSKCREQFDNGLENSTAEVQKFVKRCNPLRDGAGRPAAQKLSAFDID